MRKIIPFLLFLATPSFAAITFDVAVAGTYAASGTSSWTHTVGAGSNGVLYYMNIAGSGYADVTSVTYNGVSLTKILSNTSPAEGPMSVWMLANPPAGAHTVLVTSAGQILGGSASYFGVSQNYSVDASSQADGNSSNPTTTLTTVADNCWTVFFYEEAFGTPLAQSPDVLRATWAFEAGMQGDSNAPVTPPGSHTNTEATATGSGPWGMQTFSIAPFVAAPSAKKAIFSMSGGKIALNGGVVTIK